MNLFVLSESRGAATAPPATRGHALNAPTDDFALMLAKSTAVLRPEKPASVKHGPRESEAIDETAKTPAAEADQPPAKPDAPPEIDDADREPAEDAAADGATAPTAHSVSEAANQAVAAAAAAAANATANAAATAAAEGAAQTPGVDDSAAQAPLMAEFGTNAIAMETALEQAALSQTARSAAPANPSATPATAPVSADTPAAELSVTSLLVTAPEPALPGDATQSPAPTGQSTPGLTAVLHIDAKPSLAAQINLQSPAPSATPPDTPAPQQPPASLALGSTPAQETATPGLGAIQAVITASIRDAAPSASPTAADAPAAVPPVGPGHAPTAPAEHAGSVQTPAAPAAPTLDNVAQHVVRSVRLMMHDGQKTLTVRLIPPSLGELHIEVSSIRESLHVRLMSANPVVREALENQLTSLRETLARSGVEATSVTVSSGSTAGQASQNQFADGRQDGGTTRLGLQPDPDHNAPAGHQSDGRSTGHQGLIDVFV